MSYMSDTMRVELALPAHMMLGVLVVGATERETPEFKRTRDLLIKACEIPMQGLFGPKEKMKILRRIERVHLDMVKPYLQTDNPDPRKIGIIAYYVIQHLLDTGMLIIDEASDFGRALDVMLPALSPWEGSTAEEVKDYDNLNRSARKQVRRVFQHLQAEGYYVGISLPDYQVNEAA